MRIVNVIQRYPPAVGGAETWCQEVCRYLAQRGHNVRVLTLDVNKEEEYWRDPPDTECTLGLGRLDLDGRVLVRRYHRSLPIHSVHHLLYKTLLDQWLRVYFYGPHSAELYGHLWQEVRRADVVFLHTAPYPHNLVAFAVAKMLRKPIVMVPHFHPSHPHYERAVNYAVLKHCDSVITVTDFEKQYLAGQGVPADRIHVTGNAIHPEAYTPVNLPGFRARLEIEHGLRSEDRVITFFGRKTPEKGVGDLIQAVRALMADLPVRLFLAGPSLDWYTKRYAQLSLADRERIIDVGMLSDQDKVNLLHCSDILALPSRYEAFGIVFLEAWICGVPVLGTTEGAMPSVIENEGVLARYGDVNDLEARLRGALGDRERLRTIGARGKAKVTEHYTWEIIGAKAERAVRAAFGRGRNVMKILMCTNAYPPRFVGGAELITHAHARELRARGHAVAVFAGERNDLGPRHTMRLDSYDGIPVYRVCLHARDYSFEFSNFYHARIEELFDRVLDEYAPDVVHFHNVIGLSAGLLGIAKRRGIKTIVTLHDYWGICFKNTLMKREDAVCDDFNTCYECMPVVSGRRRHGVPVSMRSDYVALQLQSVDRFIAPSSFLADTYVRAGIDETRMCVVANGIDVERFARVQRTRGDGRLRFSFVGYLGRHKGVDAILEALSLVALERAPVRVNLVGDGDTKAHYQRRVAQLGLEDMVRFWGQVDENRITDVYRETDVLLLPSLWPENQPVSITEAMAARIPVIASRIGGIPELVDDGKTGWLVESGNAQDLAQKMLWCLRQRGELPRLGENGYRKIAGCTFERQVDRLVEIYGECTPARRPDTCENDVIVCAGRNVAAECAQVLGMLEDQSEVQARVVMADWLDEERIRAAHALWVIDNDAGLEDVQIGLRNQLPLVVPASNVQLRALCENARCGLYFDDPFEAVECLEYLRRDESMRLALGQNALKLFYATAPVEAGPV